jgi:hypothetical protein
MEDHSTTPGGSVNRSLTMASFKLDKTIAKTLGLDDATRTFRLTA